MQYVKVSEKEFKEYYDNDLYIHHIPQGKYLSHSKVFGKYVTESFKHDKYSYVIAYRLLDLPDLKQYNHKKKNPHVYYIAKEFLFMQLLTKGC